MEEADNVVLKLLREIRQDQVKQFSTIEAQARTFNGRLEVLQEVLAHTRGLATHGQVRLDLTDRRLDDIEARLAQLENR